MPSGPRTTGRTLLAIALLALVALLGAACGGDDEQQSPRPRATERPFSPDGIWNRPLADDAPLDPSSAAVVASLRAQVDKDVQRQYGPTVNARQYSTPVYTVPRDQPRVKVTLDDTATYADDLREAITSVPVPERARAAAGNDQHMVIVQPSTDTMWEFWKMHRRADGWHARAGGTMRKMSSNPGYFAGHPEFPWGATATSLPLLGGLMRPDELRRGEIDHALALALPQVRSSTWSTPAQRTDGNVADPDAVPEGARFRIDPDVDVGALGLTPAVEAMAEAAQRYGILVRDKAGTVVFYAEDPSTMETDPYPQIFGKEPMYKQMSRFPWDKLQLMKMDLQHFRGSGE